MQIRSECAAPTCSTIRQLMPSFKSLADPGKANLPTPIYPNYSKQLQRSISAIQSLISTLMQIRSECASPNLSTISPTNAELQHLADPGKANLPTPIYPNYSEQLQRSISAIQLLISTLMQIRSECASPNLSTISPNYAELQHLADPRKANLPTPIYPNYSEHLQRSISPIQLFISTLMQIRSECAAPTCSTIRQLMPSFKSLADSEKANLPTPIYPNYSEHLQRSISLIQLFITTLMQIRSECASPNSPTIPPNYAELQHLADPRRANLPTPIYPNYPEQPHRFISPIHLIISISLSTNTWTEIRSEYDYVNYVESPNLALRGSVYLPAPNYPIFSKLLQRPISLIQLHNSTLMQIRPECAPISPANLSRYAEFLRLLLSQTTIALTGKCTPIPIGISLNCNHKPLNLADTKPNPACIVPIITYIAPTSLQIIHHSYTTIHPYISTTHIPNCSYLVTNPLNKTNHPTQVLSTLTPVTPICPLLGTPLPNDFFCATTGYPMHSGCLAPASRKLTLIGLTFQCHSCADPSPT